ncbi:unnamed protein product [Medioppia subpectinata]|uniref:Protein phosphatase 1 regulatory subunit 16A n=1 Tax=Medioppia subpectinata TaxID=1979941 RepID=A0A7R9L1C6_9ACAR|nr:unnamed protein product [Medioppia subpectinata]CAG2113518.1 unnamed protein product [Medioppia subpectinata]
MMKLLIDFGANVNAKDSEQWTPLHAAATCGHLHLVKYLINKGADLLAVNADGNMPYDICEDELTLDYIESEMAKRGITQEMIDKTRATNEMQMLEDLQKLVAAGTDLESRDGQGATPLHIASANGYTTVVEFLLDNHVSTDECDLDQWQAIHAAACWGHLDVLELLVQNGADVNAKTKNGETPYDICEDPELKERIIQLKNELETKKATHPNRLKRSLSQNTRSQSVRRTSIREKSQIAKREAREEARIRHQKESEVDDDDTPQTSDAKDDDTTDSSPAPPTDAMPSHVNGYDSGNAIDLNNIDFRIDSRKKSLDSDSDVSTQNTSNQIQTQSNSNNKEAIVIRNTGYTDRDNKQEPNANNSTENQSNSGAHRGSTSESVKVEIHVTVNTTPTFNSGTLADLKKHRAEKHRNSLSHSSSYKLTKI